MRWRSSVQDNKSCTSRASTKDLPLQFVYSLPHIPWWALKSPKRITFAKLDKKSREVEVNGLDGGCKRWRWKNRVQQCLELQDCCWNEERHQWLKNLKASWHKQLGHHLFLWKEAGLYELPDSGGWKAGILVSDATLGCRVHQVSRLVQKGGFLIHAIF